MSARKSGARPVAITGSGMVLAPRPTELAAAVIASHWISASTATAIAVRVASEKNWVTKAIAVWCRARYDSAPPRKASVSRHSLEASSVHRIDCVAANRMVTSTSTTVSSASSAPTSP